MKNLDRVIGHLRGLDDDFFGQVVIRVREGKAVTITEERVSKLEDDDHRPQATSPYPHRR